MIAESNRKKRLPLVSWQGLNQYMMGTIQPMKNHGLYVRCSPPTSFPLYKGVLLYIFEKDLHLTHHGHKPELKLFADIE